MSLYRSNGAHPSDAPLDDPRLAEPGVMRAIWSSQCRVCPEPIKERDVQALTNIPGGGRAWTHVECRDQIGDQR